jgi:hypothetical protein
MRPYEDRLSDYKIPLRGAPAVIRPNRTAAGMTATENRSGRTGSVKKLDVLQLLVRGTTDILRGMCFRKVPKICECCGHKTGKLTLNESGQLRLRALRRKRGTPRGIA